jgi:hypothetical protein
VFMGYSKLYCMCAVLHARHVTSEYRVLYLLLPLAYSMPLHLHALSW